MYEVFDQCKFFAHDNLRPMKIPREMIMKAEQHRYQHSQDKKQRQAQDKLIDYASDISDDIISRWEMIARQPRAESSNVVVRHGNVSQVVF